jgi:leucyl-tRNA synthetase
MAFYVIIQKIRQHDIPPDQLSPAVFDFIFYGQNRTKIAAQSKINMDILESIRKEFLYWYPVDMRNSAKELIPNHLTFFLFHHAALFPPEHWPRIIGANGMLMIKSEKMSKSKGNWVTLKNAITKYGADSTRCALLLGAEGLDDPDWRGSTVGDIVAKLESLNRLVNTVNDWADGGDIKQIDKWFMSTLQNRVSTVTESFESLKTRTALEIALFEVWNDFRWYLRRQVQSQSPTLRECVTIWIRLLAPFIPHICEELWERIGCEGFVSLAKWPQHNPNLVDIVAEESETLLASILEDTQSIMQATKLTPTTIWFYVAARWKWKVYEHALKIAQEKGSILVGDLIKKVIQNREMKKHAKKMHQFCLKVTDSINRMGRERKNKLYSTGLLDEKCILLAAQDFLEKELRAKIEIFDENDTKKFDPENRARLAMPYRPAIFIQ